MTLHLKNLILLIMSLLSILFGCNTKKANSKVSEWPRFPATDNPKIEVQAIPLADGFKAMSFYVSTDKENVYLLAARWPQKPGGKRVGNNRPTDPDYMDYRLICLDTNGQTKYQRDLLNTDWIYGGSFGLLEGEFLLRIGDWFLVLDPTTFATKEKIPVHNSEYIPWQNTVMTRDEFMVDYQAKLDAVLKNSYSCKFLYWSPGGEYLIFVPGAAGKRSAWAPMSYEDNDLAELKQQLKSITVMLNPKASKDNQTTYFEVTDNNEHLREVEYLSAGTQLVYPNYKTRSILQYELTVKGQKVHFSTSDRDGHSLHLSLSDNLMLSLKDGAVWVMYEDILYKIH